VTYCAWTSHNYVTHDNVRCSRTRVGIDKCAFDTPKKISPVEQFVKPYRSVFNGSEFPSFRAKRTPSLALHARNLEYRHSHRSESLHCRPRIIDGQTRAAALILGIDPHEPTTIGTRAASSLVWERRFVGGGTPRVEGSASLFVLPRATEVNVVGPPPSPRRPAGSQGA
jgi:hypothetical protein